MAYRIKRSTGVVKDDFLDQPRNFPTRKAAEEWARLSHYRGHEIVESN